MENFNYRQRLGIIYLLTICTCSLLMSSCSTSDDSGIATQETGAQVIYLSDGSHIVLSDTTTYEIGAPEEAPDFDSAVITSNSENESFFDSETRATGVLRAYGYDSLEPETDWKKMLLASWWQEHYGISGTYIARYVKVHKNLSIESGGYAVPADYTDDRAKDVPMGWFNSEKKKGFKSESKSEYIDDGVSQILIIKSDVSGKIYNLNLPYDPSTFEWVYKSQSRDDFWN